MHFFNCSNLRFKVDEKTKFSLFKLFNTWLFFLNFELLQELSDRVRYLDPYWPELNIKSLIQNPDSIYDFKYVFP